MTEMEERVARAMAAKRRELIAKPLDRIWPELAQAAILAMREPTEEVLDVGFDADRIGDNALGIWRAMIDAALGSTANIKGE